MNRCLRRRKTIAVFIILFMILGVFVSNTAIYSATKKASKPPKTVAKPEIAAESAVVYCENTGEVVYDKKMNERIYPYSTTKVMTVLLAIQNLSLSQKVTISEKAASYEGSTMGLHPGEEVSVEDLLYGTMMLSGNDAAYALGEAVTGGDMPTFLALMNKTSKNIGCKDTNFVNPNGYKDENNYSTAYDMMQIFKVAMSNDLFKKIAGTKEHKLSATNQSESRSISTHISLLNMDSNVVAAKTGTWNYEGGIVFAYDYKGLRFYVSIMKGDIKKRDEDAKKLIKYAVKSVSGHKVVSKGQEVGNVSIRGGVKTRLSAYAAEDGYAYLPKEGSKDLITATADIDDKVKAPVKTGQKVGNYNIYVADDIVNSIPIVIKENVSTGWFPSQIGISNMWTVIISVVIGLLIIMYIYIKLKIRQNKRKRAIRRKRLIEQQAMRELEEEADRRRRGWNL